MADTAEIYVTNGLNETVTVITQFDNGSQNSNDSLANGQQKQVTLTGMDMFLLIHVPEPVDLNTCKLNVQSDIDLSVTHLRSSSNWMIRFVPNTLQPEVPTTVNVSLQGEEVPL
jgi:hypothetical protein